MVDDIAEGLGEAQELGGRTFDLIVLGLTFWWNLPFVTRLFVPTAFVLFGALYYVGEVGDASWSFLARAPDASSGSYYMQREVPAVISDDGSTVLWRMLPEGSEGPPVFVDEVVPSSE